MPTKSMLCTRCLTEAPPVKTIRGSFLLELFLWFLMIFPGLIYTIWRLSTRKLACQSCGAVEMIPPDSPMARRLKAADR